MASDSPYNRVYLKAHDRQGSVSRFLFFVVLLILLFPSITDGLIAPCIRRSLPLTIGVKMNDRSLFHTLNLKTSIEELSESKSPLMQDYKTFSFRSNKSVEPRRSSSSLHVTTLDDTDQDSQAGLSGFLAFYDRILSTLLGPRLVLLFAAAIYATNFPLGALMDEHLPPSAATAGRMFVAALALCPLLPRLEPQIRLAAMASGAFSALGYVSQSIALIDSNPARVSFLGSATVLIVPLLEGLVDRKPMGVRQAPQTWLAALLCFVGVGVLELHGGNGASTEALVSVGDILALIQALGFGTSCWINNKILRDYPQQFFPVTATIVATTAVLAAVWSFIDGWPFQEHGLEQYTLPGMLLFEPSMGIVAGAMIWTGLVSTSLNYSIELSALGRLPAAEASVILASEPLWAALFASLLYHSPLGVADSVGGALIVAACVANAVLKPKDFVCFRANDEKDESLV